MSCLLPARMVFVFKCFGSHEKIRVLRSSATLKKGLPYWQMRRARSVIGMMSLLLQAKIRCTKLTSQFIHYRQVALRGSLPARILTLYCGGTHPKRFLYLSINYFQKIKSKLSSKVCPFYAYFLDILHQQYYIL